MKLSLLALIGLLPLAIGVSFVYAEEYTLNIPFDITSIKCNEVTDELIVTCIFQGTEPFKVIVDNKTLTPELIEPEVIEETVDEIPVDPYEGMTREEKDIQRTIERIEQDIIEDRDSVPNAEKQLLILLKRAQDECYFGVDQGQPIQAYALFGIPTGFLYIDDTDFSRHTQLGKIAQLIEACKAWDKYRVTHLGQQYSDIAAAFNDANEKLVEREAYLSGVFDNFFENITNADEYRNIAISAHDILEEEEDAADFMCGIEGKQRGFCPSGIGEQVYEYDGTNNPALSKYLQYKESPENAIGEPKYSVKTNAKCYTLESFSKQYELDEESRKALLEAAGCRL